MKKLRELIRNECDFPLSDEVLDRFIGLMDRREVRRGKAVVETGDVNPDIYVVREGVFSADYFDGINDRCWAFALPGILMYSGHSYFCGEPAFYRYVACCNSVVYHCTKRDLDALIASSHEFAQWMHRLVQRQLYYYERINMLNNGTAAERLVSFVRNHPDILEMISNKALASYLGITQQYLSSLKRKLL